MDRNAHIPTAEIIKDIIDTEEEIRYMRKLNLKDWGGTIAQREEFIAQLRKIVASRGGCAMNPTPTEDAMHCPECDSTNCECWDFDYGIDKETGYHDAGSGARCLNCKCESYLEDFEDDGGTQ